LKTFIVGLFAVCKCLLYPYSEVHLTSSTINQAKKMVSDKIERELCDKLSPVLKYMKDNKLITFHYGKDEIRVDFEINGSKLWVDPCDDQARGKPKVANLLPLYMVTYSSIKSRKNRES
jgi:hypothetical protein